MLQMLKIPIADLNIQGGHFKFKIVKDTISVRVLNNDKFYLQINKRSRLSIDIQNTRVSSPGVVNHYLI